MAIDPAAVAILIGAADDADLTEFIALAQAISDYHFANSTIDAGVLDQIGNFLAAHYATVTNPAIKQMTLNSSSITFALPYLSSGLNSTVFGQQAIGLDYTRTLSNLTIPLKASILIL